MFKFQYLLNDNDYLEFNKFHLSNAPINKKALLFLRLMVPVMLALLFLLTLLKSEDLTVEIGTLVTCVLVSVAWFFLVKPLMVASTKLNIKMMKKHGKLPYGKNISIEFHEDYFIETTSETETKTKYSFIERMAYGNYAIYIYISPIQAYIVPLTVFESAEQRDAFCAFINHKATAQGKVTE